MPPARHLSTPASGFQQIREEKPQLQTPSNPLKYRISPNIDARTWNPSLLILIAVSQRLVKFSMLQRTYGNVHIQIGGFGGIGVDPCLRVVGNYAIKKWLGVVKHLHAFSLPWSITGDDHGQDDNNTLPADHWCDLAASQHHAQTGRLQRC